MEAAEKAAAEKEGAAKGGSRLIAVAAGKKVAEAPEEAVALTLMQVMAMLLLIPQPLRKMLNLRSLLRRRLRRLPPRSQRSPLR